MKQGKDRLQTNITSHTCIVEYYTEVGLYYFFLMRLELAYQHVANSRQPSDLKLKLFSNNRRPYYNTPSLTPFFIVLDTILSSPPCN